MEKYFKKTKLKSEPDHTRTRAPRKRFRRKVNGLFGEQTDLHRRMTKLLKTTSSHDVLADDYKAGQKHILLSQSACSKDDGTSNKSPQRDEGIRNKKQDDLDLSPSPKSNLSPGHWHPNVKEELKTPEKARLVKSKIGKLTPTAHQVFLETLKVGRSSLRPEKATRDEPKLAPLELPRFEKGCCLVLPKFVPKPGVDSTGAPAVLRKNVRKRYQGYTSADILRKRMPKEGKFERATDSEQQSQFQYSQDSEFDLSQQRRSKSGLYYRDLSHAGGVHGDGNHPSQNSIALLVEAAEAASERQNSSGGSSKGARLQGDKSRRGSRATRAGFTQPIQEAPLGEYLKDNPSFRAASFPQKGTTRKGALCRIQGSEASLWRRERPSEVGAKATARIDLKRLRHPQPVTRKKTLRNADNHQSGLQRKRRRRGRFPSQLTQKEDGYNEVELEAGSSEDDSFEETESDEEGRLPDIQDDQYDEYPLSERHSPEQLRKRPRLDTIDGNLQKPKK